MLPCFYYPTSVHKCTPEQTEERFCSIPHRTRGGAPQKAYFHLKESKSDEKQIVSENGGK